jgi:5'-3' exonuclease
MEMYKNPIHPQTQLSYVLPKESYGYLKENIKTYIEDNIPELIHHNLEYDYIFSSYLWEGHLDLNYIDIKHLNEKLMLII